MAHEQANSPRSKVVTPALSLVPEAVMRSARNRLINRRHAILNVRSKSKLSSGHNRSRLSSVHRTAGIAVAEVQTGNSPVSNGLQVAAVPCRVPAEAVPTGRPANVASKAAAVPVNKNHGAEEI